MHAAAGKAAAELEGEAAGPATDIEQRPVPRQPGEVDQRRGEPARPAAEEALVGGAVVGRVAGRRAQARAQSVAIMTFEALMTA